MKLSDFNFDLPEERIARFPADKRTGSKLMVVNRETGSISNHTFSDLPEFLSEDDFIVMNNTKVDPVRIFLFKESARIEFLIVKTVSGNEAEGFALPAKKLNEGTVINTGSGCKGVVIRTGERGRRTIRFDRPVKEITAEGFAPLPPYIKRKYDEASEYRDYDLERYQTVYSKNSGSIAAPTAGLHFDKTLLDRIREKNKILEVTLSVGPATFQKIEVDNIKDHKMGMERIRIENSISKRISELKRAGNKLLAVGTTSVRSLETYAQSRPEGENFESEIFISPGFRFQMVNKLLTNFHLPESSLFILVSAFAGLELMQKAYKIAVEKEYNFFSYGDAMLIL
ncbi:MAG: tRNA preQ1(34) S-adenosylmethionine ribosyltransferase-isomerase QueA [Acidobacteriota bacterium]